MELQQGLPRGCGSWPPACAWLGGRGGVGGGGGRDFRRWASSNMETLEVRCLTWRPTGTSGWSSAQEVLKLYKHSERRGGAGLPQTPSSLLPLFLSSEGSPHGSIHQRTMTSSRVRDLMAVPAWHPNFTKALNQASHSPSEKVQKLY